MNSELKKILILSSALLSIGATSLSAFADPMLSSGGYSRQLQKMEMMKMIDANGDHIVTKAEFDSYFGSLFDALDTDNDGSLDAKEWVGLKGKQKIDIATGGYSRELRSMKMMKLMDTNGDHKVTKDEFLAHQSSIFTKLDTSSDGELDAKKWLTKTFGK